MVTGNRDFLNDPKASSISYAPKEWERVEREQKKRHERITANQLKIVKSALDRASLNPVVSSKGEETKLVAVILLDEEMEPEIYNLIVDAGWSKPVKAVVQSAEGLKTFGPTNLVAYIVEYDPKKAGKAENDEHQNN